MLKTKANEYYRGKFNCAQSVAKAFQDLYAPHPVGVDDLARFGAGRAPEGLCGALFAARTASSDADIIRRVTRRFQATAGAVTCRDIRGGKRISCAQCVELAAAILDEELSR